MGCWKRQIERLGPSSVATCLIASSLSTSLHVRGAVTDVHGAAKDVSNTCPKRSTCLFLKWLFHILFERRFCNFSCVFLPGPLEQQPTLWCRSLLSNRFHLAGNCCPQRRRSPVTWLEPHQSLQIAVKRNYILYETNLFAKLLNAYLAAQR